MAACSSNPAQLSAGSLAFDGVDDHVVLADMPDPPAKAWTIEAWIRPTPSDQTRPDIVARRSPKGGLDTFTFRLRRDFGDVLELGLASPQGTWGMAGQAAIPNGRWTHVAATWERAQRKLRLFVDGRVDAERDCPIDPGRGPAPLWLGGDPLHGPEGRPFSGSIAELRVWDHARSSEQLSAAKGRSMRGDEPGLLLYWPVRDGQGTRIADLGPHGLHGAMGGDNPAEYAPAWSDDAPF